MYFLLEFISGLYFYFCRQQPKKDISVSLGSALANKPRTSVGSIKRPIIHYPSNAGSNVQGILNAVSNQPFSKKPQSHKELLCSIVRESCIDELSHLHKWLHAHVDKDDASTAPVSARKAKEIITQLEVVTEACLSDLMDECDDSLTCTAEYTKAENNQISEKKRLLADMQKHSAKLEVYEQQVLFKVFVDYHCYVMVIILSCLVGDVSEGSEATCAFVFEAFEAICCGSQGDELY